MSAFELPTAGAQTDTHTDQQKVNTLAWAKSFLKRVPPHPFSCRKSIRQLDPRQVHPEEKVSVHQTPDPGAGEGVSLQHVPDQGPAPGGGRTLKSDRAAGQNLVPEQTDEDEETDDPGEEEYEWIDTEEDEVMTRRLQDVRHL